MAPTATLDITTVLLALITAVVTIASAYIAVLAARVNSMTMQTNLAAMQTQGKVKEVHDIVNSSDTAMKTRMADMTSQILILTTQNATLLEQSTAAKLTAAKVEGIAEGRAGAPTPYPSVAGGNGGQRPVIDASTLGPSTVINTESMTVDADNVSVGKKEPTEPKEEKAP